VLFADEPTGSLDRANAQRVADLLVELAVENQSAAVVATHNLDLARRMGTLLDLERLVAECG
jgi:predicted ABC-type transport system involved in lysophospholipase L1 biosynthesis ATPase subunit